MKSLQYFLCQLFTGAALLLCLPFITSAQTIQATQTDMIIVNPNGNGKADPGDQIQYKVTIQNTAGPAGTGVQLNAVLDPRTTFSGAFRSTPLALPDAYAVTGNVGLNVPAASGLIANDFDDNTLLLTATAGTFPTTGGGSIMVFADGSFMYTPPAGLTGGMTDTYTYTLIDGNDVDGAGPIPGTDAGTVTFTLTNLIWFIDNASMAATSDGRLTSPFKTLADFNAGSAAAAAVIYIEHNAVAGNYTGGIVLQDNERLFGEGHTGTAAPGENLSSVLPFSLAPNSKPLPNIDGIRPVITNAAGDGVALAMNNTLRGFNVGACSDFGMENIGTNSVGTLVVSEVTIANSTGGGFDASHGSSTMMNAVFDGISSTGGVNGVNLISCGGTFTGGTGTINNASGTSVVINGGMVNLTYSGNVMHNANISMVSISNAHSGTVTFQTGTLSATNGTGIQFDDADGTYNFNGTNTLAGGNAAIDIVNGSAGTFTFSSASTITNPSGDAFVINGSNCTVTYSGSISDNGGYAVNIDNHDAGTVTFQTGSITSTGTGLRVLNSNGGIINFSSPTKTLTTTTSAGVDLTTNNGGGTMNFGGGGLVINTTSGVGFNASGGGTVTVTGTGNKINNTTGPANTNTATALNVVSTTIGASGLTFESISSGNNTAAADPANGVILSNTGSSGGLVITGTGSANSGGTIQNMVGADDDGNTPAGTGIVLFNTSGVSLKWMLLHDFSNYAVRGNNVVGFRFENNIINGVSGNNVSSPFRDSGVRLNGCSGTININYNEITGGYQHNVLYDTQSGTTNLNFIDNNVHHTNPSTGDDGFQLEAELTAIVFANVSDNTFTAHGGDHFNLSMINSANVDLTFKNNDMQGGHAVGLGQGVFILGAAYNGTFKYDISNNGTVADPFIGNKQGAAIFVNKGSGTATYSGQITNNVIGNPSITLSGSEQAQGIHASARGAGGSHRSLIHNNLIRQFNDRGIVLEAGEGSASLSVTVTNNTVSDFGSTINSLHGIHSDNGVLAGDNNQVTLDIRANNVATAANEPAGGADIRMRVGSSTDVFLAGAATVTNAATAITYISGQNPTATTVSVTVPGGTINNGPAIPLPAPMSPTLPPPP